MDQRINIINNYRFLTGNKSKPLQTRINNSLTFIVIFSIVGIVGIIGVLFSILVDWFGLSYSIHWKNSGLLVVWSILILLFLSEYLYSYILLKHIKRNIGKIENNRAEAINTELMSIFSKKMQPTSNKVLLIFGIIIFIAAIASVMLDTNSLCLTIWNYFKIPLLLFYFLLFKQTIKNLILIKRNNILFEIITGLN